MASLQKQISKCKHPNSRKTLALTKQINKSTSRNKQKLGQYMKQNLIGEKIAWFRDRLDPDISVCTPDILRKLIEKYLARFDEELEQIAIKHSVGGRKNRQHASREDIIKLTKKRELEEYNTCGIELPDLLDSHNLSVVQRWSGELRFLQNIKLKRVAKKHLNTPKSNKIINKSEEEIKDLMKKEDSEMDKTNDLCIEKMDIDS